LKLLFKDSESVFLFLLSDSRPGDADYLLFLNWTLDVLRCQFFNSIL